MRVAVMPMRVVVVLMFMHMSCAARARRKMLATADWPVPCLYHKRGCKEGSRK